MDKFTIMPSGISHNKKPIFHACWFSGEINAPQDSNDHYYEQGSGELDNILIYRIKWQDNKPRPESFNHLMDAAITAIDYWISERF